jgi:hypothetical protein
MMTVQELIDHLGKFDPNLEVWMARDGEGNGFRPVYEAAPSTYDPESDESIHPDDMELQEYLNEQCWDQGDPEEVERATQDYDGWRKSLIERVTIWPAW